MFRNYRTGYQAFLLLVAFYAAVAVWVTGNPVFFLFDDRPKLMFLGVWGFPLFLWYALVSAKLLARRRPEPLRRLKRYSRLNRGWLWRVLVLIGALVLWASAFTVLKVNIPRLVPYYADPILMAFDRMILGTDAWRLTHAVIGPQGTVVLDRLYAGWFFVLIGFMAWMIQTRNQRLQLVSLISLVVLWLVLGVGLATLLASVGPCFAGPLMGMHEFDPLMAELKGNPGGLIALGAMDYLAASYGKTDYAAGISAMPSMHVAMAVWFVLVAKAGFSSRVPAMLAAAYALIVFVGSIHLGWHYAADGIVSVLLTPAIWRLAQQFVSLPDHKPAAIQGPTQPCAT